MRRTSPREARLRDLYQLRKRVEDEIAALEAPQAVLNTKRSRNIIPECGTESAYQRHAHSGDTATDEHRVSCQPCRAAHAAHERLAATRRRLAS
jgi:hypothetical protein